MKLYILIILTFLSYYVQSKIIVNEVQVICKNSYDCYSAKNLKTLKGEFESKEHLDELSKIIARSDGVSKISYRYKNDKLIFDVINNPLVESIKVNLKNDIYEEDIILPISEGDFLSNDLKERSISFLESYFLNQGYTSVKVKVTEKYNGPKVSLIFKVDYLKENIVKEITVHSKNKYVQNKIELFLSEQLDERFRSQYFRNSIETMRTELFELGFYFVNLTVKKQIKDNNVFINVYVQNTKRQAFNIEGISSDLASKIRLELKNTTRIYKRTLVVANIKDIVATNLRKAGFVDYKVDIAVIDRIEKDNILITKIVINKVFKSKIKEVAFRGNSFFTEKELLKIYYENASEKAKYDYLDTDYYSVFTKILKVKYVKAGFVSSQIMEPSIQALINNKGRILFKVIEGARAKVSEIKIEGADKDIETFIKRDILSQKIGKPFNPIALDTNLKDLRTEMYNKGYYFFDIINEDKPSLVTYEKENTSVVINIKVVQNKPLVLNNVLYLGNIKTKNKLLFKYLELEKGNILTRDFVKSYQSRLLGLGIFSNVSIVPLPLDNNKADLVVNVKEKDFGIFEVAPGIRTDLGPKVSGSITYNNLGGMNRIVSFKGQVNRRFDLSSIDAERRDMEPIIEYDAELSYIENKIFSTDLDFTTSVSKFRRRLFQFDADIQKISYTFSSQFNEWFRASLTQQLETISQFNSTSEFEKGKFEIGSITPSVTFDFRNSRINPTSGAYFNLSFERASPDFKSQENDELKVDYYKIVSRNLFYLPFTRGTLAISLAGGMEENLAKNRFNDSGDPSGYIPQVKVFRLSGMDIVRGYDDEEINRLADRNGKDISEVIVDDKAYMINMKIEPRFFINDTFIAGVFFDAGRVFVGDFQADQLRSSYGVTFKYLTPVGTLDFDYGIKTLRKREPGGRLESPGRLHVSIGFF